MLIKGIKPSHYAVTKVSKFFFVKLKVFELCLVIIFECI